MKMKETNLLPESAIRSQRTSRRAVLISFGVFVICFLLSFVVGHYGVSLKDTLNILTGGIFSNDGELTIQAQKVVLNIRLPRILGGSFIGAALAVAGAVYQGLFKNPMAAPDILGSSAGAGFGAALGITLSLSSFGITLVSFVMGLVAVIIAFVAATRFKLNPTLGLILAGMVIASLFNAGISYLKLIADPADKLPAITYWLMGSLADLKLHDLPQLLTVIVLGLLPLFMLSPKLNIMTLGDSEASALGINVRLIRFICILSATLITSVSVAYSGIIGWVGLLIPHIARRFTGPDFRFLIPVSAFTGGTFLLIADNIARTAAMSEIPIGILTAVVGAPFFLFLILKNNSRL